MVRELLQRIQLQERNEVLMEEIRKMGTVIRGRFGKQQNAGRTAETVQVLGLYKSTCCHEELLFDRNDSFSRCTRCNDACDWKLLETVISTAALDLIDEVSRLEIRFATSNRALAA
jgi:hypothetical protein